MWRVSQLPIRIWLALVLVCIVAIPALSAWSTYVWQAQQPTAVPANVMTARHFLAANVSRWRYANWQATARAQLKALGVDARLSTEDRQPVFSTSPSHLPAGWDGSKFFVAGPNARKLPVGYGVLFFPRIQQQNWLAPLLVGLLALLLTLTGAAWFLGRTVLRPLDAMSRAAQGIVDGHLDVHIPPSRVKEVARVTAALETMSAGLQSSLQRQADLEQERRLFVSAIAHDLRTPLFMLRGYLEGLEGGVATTPEKIAHYVRACRAKADALERLIADLFAYTRMEHLEQTPEQEPLELGALLRQAVEGVHPLAAEKGVTLSLDASPADCPLLGDGQLLTRAVDNLLDNALRHTPDGGRIWVRWNRDDANLVFKIEDSGPGIAKHDLPHMFAPLYRGESSRNRRTGGAGLGLAIARRILQAHEGDLTAANSTFGGAVFVGTLPQRPDIGPAPSSLSVSKSIQTGT